MLKNKMIEPKQPAEWCVIWMHGLGADGNDMAMLVEQMPIQGLTIRHVFLDAPIRPVTINNHYPMPAWYDILGADLNAREDEQGIAASRQAIEQAIIDQIDGGLSSRQILLAGFSQGGAMALHVGLNWREPLAGIVSLSAYLPLASKQRKIATETLDCPIFMASGQHDPIVQHAWSRATYENLQRQGMKAIEWHSYPMEHQVCAEEVNDLSAWLQQVTALRVV